jgi:hypothetical protein
LLLLFQQVPTWFEFQHAIAAVTATDIAQPGTALVFVFNPPEGGTTFVSGAIGVMSTTRVAGRTQTPSPSPSTCEGASIPMTDPRAESSLIEKVRAKCGVIAIARMVSVLGDTAAESWHSRACDLREDNLNAFPRLA